eukprot:g1959.t1
MEGLSSCMKETHCDAICGIVITHLHHDHFGGFQRVQDTFGPNIPVYKSEVPEHWWKTYRAIRAKGLLGRFVDNETGELYFHPKRNLPKGTRPLFGQAALSRTKRDEETAARGASSRAMSGAETGESKQASKLADTSDAEFDFLETELQYSKEQRKQLPFFFAFMKDARDFYENLSAPDAPFKWHVIRDGDLISTPDRSAVLRCVQTPGHASDHFAFALLGNEDEGEKEMKPNMRCSAIFSGDHILGEGTSVVVDMFDYMSSLDRLLTLRPRVLLCGHGPVVRDGVDLLTRYKRHRRSREVQVWQSLLREDLWTLDDGKEEHEDTTPQMRNDDARRHRTSERIAAFLYRDTPKDKMPQATTNVHKILHSLFREGHVAASFRSSPTRWISVETLGSPYERSQGPFFETVCWTPVATQSVHAVMERRARFVSGELDREAMDDDGPFSHDSPDWKTFAGTVSRRVSKLRRASKL